MYDSTTTVTVGRDVHARSIRVAAVRADELLEERTLPYDEEAVEQLLRRWPGVRCCYEAGSVCTGIWSSAGSIARLLRLAWCRSGRVTGSRPIVVTRAVRAPPHNGCWHRASGGADALAEPEEAVRIDLPLDRLEPGQIGAVVPVRPG